MVEAVALEALKEPMGQLATGWLVQFPDSLALQPFAFWTGGTPVAVDGVTYQPAAFQVAQIDTAESSLDDRTREMSITLTASPDGLGDVETFLARLPDGLNTDLDGAEVLAWIAAVNEGFTAFIGSPLVISRGTVNDLVSSSPESIALTVLPTVTANLRARRSRRIGSDAHRAVNPSTTFSDKTTGIALQEERWTVPIKP